MATNPPPDPRRPEPRAQLRPGDRVVMRYRLPAGSDFAVSDVIGELLALGEQVSVCRSSGEIVAVARGDVVALKVLGPPPDPRRRVL